MTHPETRSADRQSARERHAFAEKTRCIKPLELADLRPGMRLYVYNANTNFVGSTHQHRIYGSYPLHMGTEIKVLYAYRTEDVVRMTFSALVLAHHPGLNRKVADMATFTISLKDDQELRSLFLTPQSFFLDPRDPRSWDTKTTVANVAKAVSNGVVGVAEEGGQRDILK